MIQSFHVPGRPKSPEPPELVKLAASITHPQVRNLGITTTKDGMWALLANLKSSVETPIKTLEKESLGFPVIYVVDTDQIPVARPAFPSQGE